jgi:L-alanine-DL-glutamate epimerase-like enolase superfamily enzyme
MAGPPVDALLGTWVLSSLWILSSLMPLTISICPYRLLFKHPFGTSHGLRDGTDALFIRLEEDGVFGYGEVTLPPYVKETVPGAMERLRVLADQGPWSTIKLGEALADHTFLDDMPALRAGLQMAYIDHLAKKTYSPVYQVLKISKPECTLAVMTLGIGLPEEVLHKLQELPGTGAIKLKVGDDRAPERLELVLEHTTAKVLLDGNQGMTSVPAARALVERIPMERLIGFEQPFETGRDMDSAELSRVAGVTVFADESLQTEEDMAQVAGSFGGVNIKLMKCGGLDRAKRLAERARESGLKVMLGSMSESSLGCTAMAQLAGLADVVDLDGPWLLKNDPWKGISVVDGRMRVPADLGLGVSPLHDLTYSGA